MPAEEVIELSVEETNKLRAKLGLKPLRLNNDDDESPTATDDAPEESSQRLPENGKARVGGGGEEEVLELSVDETNKLREKLGLPPLRSSSSSKSKIQDAKLQEKQDAIEQEQAKKQAQLEDDVEKGITTTFTEQSLGNSGGDDVNSWAAKLRKQKAAEDSGSKDDKKSKKKKKKSSKDKNSNNNKYDQSDLKGMNVSHAASELEAGSTTVMTLSDAPILQTKESNPYIVTGLNDDANTPQLENVNLVEKQKQADGLKKKRQLEMGMGRAGGYAGYDDDEFMELGGTGVPSRSARGAASAENGGDKSNNKKRTGFLIGDDTNAAANNLGGASDLFAMESGKAISLEPGQADVQASDFMTEQEDMEVRGKDKKKKRKDKFDSKKKKKKDKKERKKHRRRRQAEEEEDDESEEEATAAAALAKASTEAKSGGGGKSLLDELEETAEESILNNSNNTKKKSRKRNRSDDDDDDDDKDKGNDAIKKDESLSTGKTSTETSNDNNKEKENEDKRAKYDAIMDKGNARTKQAFAPKIKKTDDAMDEEPDDAFLNAALAKARRLKKLRGMNAGSSSSSGNATTSTATGGGVSIKLGAAEAVAEAVQSQSSMPDATMSSTSPTTAGGGGGGVTFSVDDTREFTRALRAKTEQQSRQQTKAAAKKKDNPSANTISTVVQRAAVVKKEDEDTSNNNDNKMEVETVKQEENNGAEDADMAELAKGIKDDDDDNNNNSVLDGGTGASVPVGRGLAGVLGLYKQTGELTRKNAGKEKLRGRAKDERTYQDYDEMDLKKVVKIDERYATDKDREMASREVKLEYRDKHGRLLTRKAAFRELCYDFHGHGSSKRKEEQRQKQMAREEAEARLASQQAGGAGTLGALKATQKATGKAHFIYKT